MTTELPNIERTLEILGACGPSMDWSRAYDADWERAWRECPRGDWLLWTAARVGVEKELVVSTAVWCTTGVIVIVRDGREHRDVLWAANDWCVGECEDVHVARAAHRALEAKDQHSSKRARLAYVATALVGKMCHHGTTEDDRMIDADRAYASVWGAAQVISNIMGPALPLDESRCAPLKEELAKAADRVRQPIPWSKVEEKLREVSR